MCIRPLKVGVEDMGRTTVAIGGFSSEVGKTTLLCELLRALPLTPQAEEAQA